MLKDKIKSLPQLRRVLNLHRKQGKIIAFTNGCFEILHPGHIRYLERIKKASDILVVGINSDRSVRRIKGEKRLLVPEESRAIVVAGLESVDYVTIFDEDTPLNLIKNLKPDILAKGGDWEKDSIVGRGFVEAYGGKCISVPFVEGYSTTRLIKRIVKKYRP